MKIQILTIFPELFVPFTENGLVARAIEKGSIELQTVQLRDFAVNTHGQIDDTPYGGGSGMVLMAETASKAVEAAKSASPGAKIVLFTPRGKRLDQRLMRKLAGAESVSAEGSSAAAVAADLILLCTRYEGVDQRFIDRYVDLEVSLGDYILMGGEVPAMALVEGIARLLPGVLNNERSAEDESFESDLLEYPHYTKPQNIFGAEVPPVLLSGNHANIASWRKEQSESLTLQRRPDLLNQRQMTCELSVALVHYPVLNKRGEIVTSSITNIDLPDIARSACTYGLTRFYVIHPTKALRRLADNICQHWNTGYGSTYNPNRSEALELIVTVPDFDEAIADIERRTGRLPKLVTTSARKTPNSTSFTSMAGQLKVSKEPHLLILGTGWGLADEILNRADIHLEPIDGPTDYNHLSVRAAAAIMLDRIVARRSI